VPVLLAEPREAVVYAVLYTSTKRADTHSSVRKLPANDAACGKGKVGSRVATCNGFARLFREQVYAFPFKRKGIRPC